ncbi:MAG: hypothetical protein C0609_01185 [Deltaproteobacteria bacterium]|nr:MAG: hypothetical protein C0609_01185 [Deltaproteobacteria bacterium]
MTLPKGLSLVDLAARCAIDLGDPEERRWATSLLITFFNEGIRDLARDGVFSRVDLFTPAAGERYFSTHAEANQIIRVEYDSKALIGASRSTIQGALGDGWRERAGTPTHFIPERGGVRICPSPGTSGDAFIFEGAGAVSEVEGGKVAGDGLECAKDPATTLLVHFTPGDGNVTNSEAARRVLRVEYSYFPRPFEQTDLMPSRFEDALSAYALWRALSISEVPEEVARAEIALARWHNLKRELFTESTSEGFSAANNFSPLEAN